MSKGIKHYEFICKHISYIFQKLALRYVVDKFYLGVYQGLHLLSRLQVSHKALKKEWFWNASRAYSEQLGVKRQHEPSRGLIKNR